MLVFGIDEPTAFDLLRWRSQEANVKLRPLAEQIATEFRELSGSQTFPPRSAYANVLLTAHLRIDAENQSWDVGCHPRHRRQVRQSARTSSSLNGITSCAASKLRRSGVPASYSNIVVVRVRSRHNRIVGRNTDRAHFPIKGQPHRAGTAVDPRNLLRVVEGVGVHTLRHSAAMGWLEAGVHIKAVADLLGHSSIAITGDVYGHTSDDVARAASSGPGRWPVTVTCAMPVPGPIGKRQATLHSPS